MQKRVTVAICTYNRCQSLQKTLESVFAQITDFAFGILVVDNASTDGTQEAIRSIQNAPIPVDYVLESQQGITFARNRALDAVTTPFIAFIDDDEIVEPGWLAALIGAFDVAKPTPSVVGGQLRIKWTQQQPSWMPDELLGMLGRLDYGSNLKIVKMVNSGNFAFPIELARAYRFNTSLGLFGNQQNPGEDAEILRRIRRNGGLVYYQPAAVVTHIVGQARESRAYLYSRSRAQGHQDAIISVINPWPGRRQILWLMAKDAFNRRHWWKRIFLNAISLKLAKDIRERTWTRAV
ncbi:MAG TPA: glycosyltransferase, partial [Aggregatilineales bacterium]|nr:glycosyltransferase [Aggregatilineales bacterium]